MSCSDETGELAEMEMTTKYFGILIQEWKGCTEAYFNCLLSLLQYIKLLKMSFAIYSMIISTYPLSVIINTNYYCVVLLIGKIRHKIILVWYLIIFTTSEMCYWNSYCTRPSKLYCDYAVSIIDIGQSWIPWIIKLLNNSDKYNAPVVSEICSSVLLYRIILHLSPKRAGTEIGSGLPNNAAHSKVGTVPTSINTWIPLILRVRIFVQSGRFPVAVSIRSRQLILVGLQTVWVVYRIQLFKIPALASVDSSG